MSADKKALSGNHHEPARPNPVEGCPLTAALAAIGGKWKLIIVYFLAESPKHFAALRIMGEDVRVWGRGHLARQKSR